MCVFFFFLFFFFRAKLSFLSRMGQDRLSCLQDIAAAKATGKTGEAYMNAVKNSVDKFLPLRHQSVEDVSVF